MAVIYAPKQNSGGIGNGLGIVGTLLSFVPGAQGVGAGMRALGAAANGDYAGAAKSLAGLGGGTDAAANAATTAASAVTPQLRSSSADELQRMFQDYNRRNR